MKPKLKPAVKIEGTPKKKLLPKKVDQTPTPTKKYNALNEVIDYSHEFSIFYSGVEYEKWFEWVYEIGVRNFLMSYEYIKGKGSNIMRRFEQFSDIRLFIDSGAYTIFDNPDFEGYTNEQWEERIRQYLKWARKHKDHIFAIADLDLQEYVGVDVVTDWRKRYFEPFMLETGIPVCFVWHPADGEYGWERMCQRYPYVATSLVSDDLSDNDITQKIKIAEKYNAVIQGMGSTRTSILPNLPFYSVDSTTFLVGLQYGEINYWDAAKNKMTRLKKEKWQREYLDAIINATGLDQQRLLDEEKEEMIKANVYAFVQAEKFIRQMHKKIIYWQKPKINKVSLNNLPEGYLPSPDWLNGVADNGDYKDYAARMNVSSELDEIDVKSLLTFMCAFLKWDDPLYAEFKEAVLNADGALDYLHDTYVNRIVTNDEDKIDDLREFFKNCLEGNDTKLLYLGTNFDRQAKERDYYIDDTEYETIDVSETEVYQILQNQNLLPVPQEGEDAPEIDCLDDEIFSSLNLTPMRDSSGKFLKGQRQVLKPKKLYSDKYPKFACDVCYQAQKCPEYKAGMVCAFNKMFQRYDTRSMVDLIQLMQGMVDLNVGRMQRAMVMEVIGGGMIDNTVSSMITQNMQLVNTLKQMYETASAEVIKQTRVVRADGSYEETTSLTNPTQGGVLETLMRNMLNKSTPDEEEHQNDLVVIDTSV